MKKIVMKCQRNKIDSIQGWLFTYAGLRLVVTKEITNWKWWRVYEYSTGCNLGSKPSGTTRKKAILNAQKLLDRLGSLRICKGLQTAINQSGILNPVELVSEVELERLPEEDAKLIKQAIYYSNGIKYRRQKPSYRQLDGEWYRVGHAWSPKQAKQLDEYHKRVAQSPFERQILMLSDEELGKSLNKMIKLRSEIPNTLIEQWRIEDADRKIDFMQKEWQRRGEE